MSSNLSSNRESNFAQYSQYNNTLRSWLVAFGVAVPAVFISSKDAQAFLQHVPDLKNVIATFLAGVCSQIVVSFINKFVAWSAYHRDDLALRNTTCTPFTKKVASFENAIWLDFTCDLITIACFAWAICQLFAVDTPVH
jgi:hypothetical protein